MDSENTGIPATMLVSPSGGYQNGGGFGWGGDWAWIIILLLAFNGGWGGGFGGGFGGNMMLGYDFPWLLNGQNGSNNNVSEGFRDQMIHDSITSIGDKIVTGFGDVQTALCGGFAGVNATVNGAQNAIAQQLYTNQIADLQQSFALQSQLANCCCENRAATADLKYTLASEACATRTANTQNTQAILDKLCQLELDGYKRENDSLRTQLSDAKIAASQTAQNAFIAQGLANEVDALYNRLSNCPVPSTPVYGKTPIFTCGSNCGCGCGA